MGTKNNDYKVEEYSVSIYYSTEDSCYVSNVLEYFLLENGAGISAPDLIAVFSHPFIATLISLKASSRVFPCAIQ